MKCPVCNRELISGRSIDQHHLLPKTHGNRDKKAYNKENLVTLHKVCHMKIHSLFTTAELLREYNTIEKILTHPDMQHFVTWVSKKSPRFYITTRQKRRKNDIYSTTKR